jgi:hypothetical protein
MAPVIFYPTLLVLPVAAPATVAAAAPQVAPVASGDGRRLDERGHGCQHQNLTLPSLGREF